MNRREAIKRIKQINLILNRITNEIVEVSALVDERATLIAEHDLFEILLEHEGKRLEYGHCPQCDESCQPEYGDDDDEEFVVCCDCKIEWTLHHEDPTDKRDNTEPWRTYRISYVRSFADDLIQPYACKDE